MKKVVEVEKLIKGIESLIGSTDWDTVLDIPDSMTFQIEILGELIRVIRKAKELKEKASEKAS